MSQHLYIRETNAGRRIPLVVATLGGIVFRIVDHDRSIFFNLKYLRSWIIVIVNPIDLIF